MSAIMFDTKSVVRDTALVKEKEMLIKTSSKTVTTTEVAAPDAKITVKTTVGETKDEVTSTDEAAGDLILDNVADENVNGDAETSDAIIGDEIPVDGMAEGEVILDDSMPVFDGGMGGDIGFNEGMYKDPMMETGMAAVKDPLLSSWPFVIGVSAAVLAISVFLGALLARLKIKKGIELYED